MSNTIEWVKKIYIYLFSAIGLVVFIIGSTQLINLGLKTWVFTKADLFYDYPLAPQTDKDSQSVEIDRQKLEEYQKNTLASRRQQEASSALAMVIVGAPLFLYHWRLARKEM
jgi:hypothetical protein